MRNLHLCILFALGVAPAIAKSPPSKKPAAKPTQEQIDVQDMKKFERVRAEASRVAEAMQKDPRRPSRVDVSGCWTSGPNLCGQDFQFEQHGERITGRGYNWGCTGIFSVLKASGTYRHGLLTIKVTDPDEAEAYTLHLRFVTEDHYPRFEKTEADTMSFLTDFECKETAAKDARLKKHVEAQPTRKPAGDQKDPDELPESRELRAAMKNDQRRPSKSDISGCWTAIPTSSSEEFQLEQHGRTITGQAIFPGYERGAPPEPVSGTYRDGLLSLKITGAGGDVLAYRMEVEGEERHPRFRAADSRSWSLATNLELQERGAQEERAELATKIDQLKNDSRHPTKANLSGTWSTGQGLTGTDLLLEQDGEKITGHGYRRGGVNVYEPIQVSGTYHEGQLALTVTESNGDASESQLIYAEEDHYPRFHSAEGKSLNFLQTAFEIKKRAARQK